MLKEHYLYRHIRGDINQPFYIGIGTKPSVFNGLKTEYKRAYDFTTNKRSGYWINVFNKANKNITVDILYESEDYSLIKEKEAEFIILYKRKDLENGTLVNLTDGGEGVKGKIVSKKTRQLLSLKIKGRSHTQETINKIKLNHASKQPGYKHIVSGEQRKKISQTLSGRYLKKDVLCIETGIIYPSVRELCNAMFNGRGAAKVIQALSDKYINKSYKGYHFSYDTSNTNISYPSYYKRIVCVETGRVYKTITDCVIEMCGSKTNKRGLSKAIIQNKKFNGLTFKAI
jgi:hypothetical protein